MISRRLFLALSGVSLLAPVIPGLSQELKDRKLIFITLRGGMDGLAAFPLLGDKNLINKRPEIWSDDYFETNDGFGIHPALKSFKKMWNDGEASIVHAVGHSKYWGRSHFDGQNLLQTGHHLPYKINTGWLGRSLDLAGTKYQGTAMDLPIPLILRGAHNLESRSPSYFSPPNEELLRDLANLNNDDNELKEMFSKLAKRRSDRRTRLREIKLAETRNEWGGSTVLSDLASIAGRELKSREELKIAVFDYHGFDTHSRQGGSDGEHAEQLNKLDVILNTLKRRMRKSWENTLVVAATEFGRNVFQNGSSGTDHGFGSAIILAGGLVSKSQVYTDWPGLKPDQLFEGNDLNVTIHQNAVFAAAIRTVFGLSHEKIMEKVFFNDSYLDLSKKLFKI